MKIKTFYKESFDSIDSVISDEIDADIILKINPRNDKWNDFTYKIRCDFKIIKPVQFRAVLYMAFKPNKELLEAFNLELDYIDFNKLLEITTLYDKSTKYFQKESFEVFSMFTEMQNYDDLIRTIGIESANAILEHHNDLLYLKNEKGTSRKFKEYINSKIFKKAFMRSYEAFYAFHNSDQILNGLNLNPHSNISENLKLEYKLISKKKHNSFNLNFDSASILPKRINVLIGKNGLGKSRALYSTAISLIDDKRYLLTKHNERPLFNNLLAIGTPGETSSSFPPEKKKSKIRYRRIIMGRQSQGKASYSLGHMISQLIRSEDYIGAVSRWKFFLEVVYSLKLNDPLIVKLVPDSKADGFSIIDFGIQKYVILEELRSVNEERQLLILSDISNQPNFKTLTHKKPVPLSSGQSAFIKFAIQASLFIEQGSLVLLDEPETHLHPNYISKFMFLLNNILRETKSVAIIATHSAYIVREVPRSQVQVFKEDENGNILIDNPRLKTFGSEIDSISYFVFEDQIHNRLVKQIIDQIPKNKNDQKLFIKEIEDELSTELLMFLKRTTCLGENDD